MHEREFFLKVLKDYVHGNNSSPQNVDLRDVCNIATMHQVQAIVYYQLNTIMDMSLLSNAYAQILFWGINRIRAVEMLKKMFHDEGIEAVVVKGTSVSKYYPNPEFRSMGDIDIVSKNRDAVHTLLCKDGASCLEQSSIGDWKYEYRGLEVELHDRLVYDTEVNYPEIITFFNQFEQYIKDDEVYELDENFHFLFVLVHLRRHLMDKGVGFRQFLDLALIIKHDETLNWRWIKEKLQELKLYSFASTVFALIENWFGICASLEYNQIEETIKEEMTDFIFKNGVFGFNNPNNLDSAASNEIWLSKYPRAIAKLRRAMSLFFPRYEYMISKKQYSFLINRRFLLPYAWMLRLYRTTKKGSIKEKFNVVQRSFVSDEYIEKREIMFRNWGLAS